MTTIHDHRQTHCRRLGHTVEFRYCRTQEDRTVCIRILDCWWQQFGVHEFLSRELPAAELQKIESATPTPKMDQLLELIERAKRMATSPSAGPDVNRGGPSPKAEPTGAGQGTGDVQ